MTLLDFVQPTMTTEAKAVMRQAFEDARLLQEEMLEKAKALDREQ